MSLGVRKGLGVEFVIKKSTQQSPAEAGAAAAAAGISEMRRLAIRGRSLRCLDQTMGRFFSRCGSGFCASLIIYSGGADTKINVAAGEKLFLSVFNRKNRVRLMLDIFFSFDGGKIVTQRVAHLGDDALLYTL